MQFLPDTNVLISYFEGSQPDKSFLTELIAKEDLFISPIVIAELRPLASKENQGRFNDLIRAGIIIDVNLEIGLLAGQYRSQYNRKTKKIYIVDCLIAATCKLHNLTLVTHNTKDYPMKDIKILKPS